MQKLRTKTIPCLVMLLAGATSLLICIYNKYEVVLVLKVLLASLLAGYFIGTLVKVALDKIVIIQPAEEVSVEEAALQQEEEAWTDAEGEIFEEPYEEDMVEEQPDLYEKEPIEEPPLQEDEDIKESIGEEEILEE